MTDLVSRFIHRYGRLPTERDPDYLEMLRMTKYRVLPVPDKKPGKCANCGSTKNDGRQYVDFGLEIDWYGIVYICGFCLRDIAQSVGLFKDLQERLETAKAELLKIDKLQQQGTSLDERLLAIYEEVREYYANLHAIRDNSSPNGDVSVGTNSEQSSEQRAIETKSGTPESTTGAGRKNVPSFTDLLNAD